jgi:protein required for attachment to host cells
MNMTKNWIVVAESSRARLYAMKNLNTPLVELEDLSHPEGRLPASELKSDRTARVFRGRGMEHHPVEPHVDPKRHEAMTFAKQIADRLDLARAKGEFEGVMLIAPPEFLGVLRDSLSAPTAKCVVKSLNKNLIHLGEAEIREHLVE